MPKSTALQALQERIEALEAALHALVAKEPLYDEDANYIGLWCVYCDQGNKHDYLPDGATRLVPHAPDCPWRKARELLEGVGDA